MRARKGHITPDKLSFSQFYVSFARLFHRQVYNQANWQPNWGKIFQLPELRRRSVKEPEYAVYFTS